MINSAVFEVAASESTALIAAARFERNVQIWDVTQKECLREIDTIFVGGARNLALAPEAGVLITGNSNRSGQVAAYNVQSGDMLWKRHGLVYPSSLHFSSSVESILCTCNERSSVLRLDVHTGATIETMSEIRRDVEGSSEDVLIIPPEKRTKGFGPLRLMSRGKEPEIESLSFV